MAKLAYLCLILFAVPIGSEHALSRPQPTTVQSSADRIALAAKRLKMAIKALETGDAQPTRELLRQSVQAMQEMDSLLDLYFHGTRKKALGKSVELTSLRRAVISLQAGPNPILVYANDALRYHPDIHISLAGAYEKLGEARSAERHRMAANLAKKVSRIEPAGSTVRPAPGHPNMGRQSKGTTR